MTVSDALHKIRKLGMDTSLFIYFVEAHPLFGPVAANVLQHCERGTIEGIASALTYTETLTKPFAMNDAVLERAYIRLLSRVPGISCPQIGREVAARAARLRGRYSVKTPDALHIATALHTGCDAFLTGDVALKRLSSEIPILVLGELTL